LNISWNGEGLVFENYLTRSRVISNALLTHILSELTDFLSIEEIINRFARKGSDSWEDTLQTLIDKDILVIRGSELDLKEKRINENWKWDQSARYFHFSTKDVKYSFDPIEEKKYFIKLAESEPLPNHYKDYPGARFIKLASNIETNYLEQNEPLSSILLRRRTIRRFDRNRKISFDQLSRILSLTWGKTYSIDQGLIERRVLKTSPSGGCRHPIEVYLILNRVDNISKGIYHYSVRQHGLELIKQGNFEEKIIEYCSGQPWFTDSAVLFVMTAVLERSMWRYRNSRTYRIIQLDAGHLAQTFHLAATSLNLGPLTTAGIQDTQLESELGIDGITEVVIYVCALGVPIER
jgi:SagB-type dehydrogenase family enzyme